MTSAPRLSKAIGCVFLAATTVQATNRGLFSQLVPQRLGQYRDKVQFGMTVALGAMGISFFFPASRLFARWSTTTLLVATLPFAIGQVRDPETMRRLNLPMPLVVARIPVQMLMVAAIWRATGRPEDRYLSSASRPKAP